MNPSYLLSELQYCFHVGMDLRSKYILAQYCIESRFARTWSQSRQALDDVRVSIGGSKYKLALRNNGSDIRVFTSILKDGEYNIPLIPWSKLETVIDAGANIGIASLFFFGRNPSVQIACVEPERGNVKVLERNLLRNGLRATVIPAALWSEPTTAQLAVMSSAMGHRLLPANSRTCESTLRVNCMTLPEIADIVGFQRISLLKIDIEGAEMELLRNCGSWMERVDRLIVEPEGGRHGRIEISRVLRKHGFTVVRGPRHNVIYCYRPELSESPQSNIRDSYPS